MTQESARRSQAAGNPSSDSSVQAYLWRNAILTHRPTASLAAFCLYALLGGAAAHAHSITSFNRTLKLNVPVEITRPFQAITNVSRLPLQTAQYYRHRRHEAYHRTYSRVLMSPRRDRSGVGDPTSVVGRLGSVLEDNTQIVAGRERQGRVLSVVGKGQKPGHHWTDRDPVCCFDDRPVHRLYPQELRAFARPSGSEYRRFDARPFRPNSNAGTPTGELVLLGND